MRRAALLAGVLLAAACSKDGPGAGGGPGAPAAGKAPGAGGGGAGKAPVQYPVEVVPVGAAEVEYAITAVGSIEAFEEVQVVARMAGVVERVQFEEGESVQRGQALADIDPDRFRFAVTVSQSAIERAEAERAEAAAALARREEANVRHPGLIPAEEIESWRTRVRTAEAELAQRKVALEAAQLDLREARVLAPTDGIIDTRRVQTGQRVQPGDVIATLVRREPLLMRFEVSSAEAGAVAPGGRVTFRVRGDAFPYEAEVTHVGATAAEASRMVEVTARVTDPRREALRPGAFAEVRIPVRSQPDALVVPQTAIRPSERGFLAFVVEDGVARERVLELGLRTEDGLVEVRSGLAAGETLVVRGGEALRDGVAVRVDRGAAPGVAVERSAT